MQFVITRNFVEFNMDNDPNSKKYSNNKVLMNKIAICFIGILMHCHVCMFINSS